MMQVPAGSIYYQCYTWGLKHVPLQEWTDACRLAGKQVRQKDVDNYWNGWQNSDLYGGTRDVFAVSSRATTPQQDYFSKKYSDYPEHPYNNYPDIIAKWVPCNASNKPMIKWSEGCMTKIDASCFPGSVYLGENMKGCKTIVIDCDGDHEIVDDKVDIDLRTVAFLYEIGRGTHMLSKPKKICEYEGWENTGIQTPASFHLTFRVDRIIPTMHFPWCHIDVVGNEKNSLRYLKNKEWNGLQPAYMTDNIWEMIKRYVENRRRAYEHVLV